MEQSLSSISTHASATSLQEFFRSLEKETAESDFAALADRHAEQFVAASPNGAKIAARSVFQEGLPQRKQMVGKLGALPPRIVSLATSALDARYALAKARWQLDFSQNGQTKTVFADSTYVVDTGEQPFKILLYLTSQDLMKVLAEHGIL